MSNAAVEEDVCPNCGRLSTLVEVTGWCAECTQEHDPEIKICPCGAFFKKSAQVSKCWACRKEEWLTKHADEIEELLAKGLTLTAAIKQVADKIRPICHSCGKEIRGGRRAARFCRTTPECRDKQRQYRALRRTGLTPDVAAAIASGRVTVLR